MIWRITDVRFSLAHFAGRASGQRVAGSIRDRRMNSSHIALTASGL